MEVEKEMDTKERKGEKGFFGALSKTVKESIKKDGIGVGGISLFVNVAAAVIGFLLAGCHLAFGAYPLGVAFVSAIPSSVWPALAGAVLGSLMLGRAGMIYAMICVLAVFLRIIISGSDDKKGGSALFSEPISLRASASLISGFVAAVYEILLGGFRGAGVIFGVSMIAFSTLFTFVFYGAFYHGIGVRSLILGKERIFERKSGADNRGLMFFKISASAFIALISLSLQKYDIFGISLSFVFAGCITLFAAKRFGAFYGAAVGFFSSVAVSGTFSAAYALLGIIAGALFAYGTRYALTAGGAALSLWGSYVSGVSGFLSLFPEFLISLCIITPVLKYFESEAKENDGESAEEKATDMVGTMALAYRNRQQTDTEAVEKALRGLIPIVSGFLPLDYTAEDFAGFLKIISDTRESTFDKREIDEALTERLEDGLSRLGVNGGIIRAFGGRIKHIVFAAEDRDGTLVTSPEIIKEIERATSLAFSVPKYYRRGDMALMECESIAKYKIKAAYLTERGGTCEISGDSVGFFDGEGFYSYGVISDGMGSGSVAKKTSDFAVSFLRAASSCSSSRLSAAHMINSLIRRQRDECSATLDVFCFDTLTGEAEFIKSGAAASFIKRGGALYRIKSETIPLGVMKRLDAERVRVDVADGDTVIMISDGICEPSEEAPWLVDLLNDKELNDTDALAGRIIAAARLNNAKKDDMSVLVMKIALA